MIRTWAALALAACAFMTPARTPAAPVRTLPPQKQRLIVLSDIEADADDTQSLIRLLLYANEIDIEGLIATTSVWQKDDVHPEAMRRVIAAYGAVQPNLLKHEPGYPAAALLVSLIKEGQRGYGMSAIGAGKDTEGSEAIIRSLERDDPRPLWISAWGGTNTLAQALIRIRDTKSRAEAKRMIGRLRVYAISDQDDCGAWIRRTFPDLFYIVSTGPYSNATWTAINKVVDGIDNVGISNHWLATHVQQGHGPLGAVYPDVAYGMEGDTPAFLSLVPNGLNDPEHPEFGGWGGRYELSIPSPLADSSQRVDGGIPVSPETRAIWTNAVDTFTPAVPSPYGRPFKAGDRSFSDFQVTLWRWRSEFQNDLAARMSWSTLDYERANHPPVPGLANADRMTVRSGSTIVLDASRSADPDGDSLSFHWFHYPEAGSYRRPIAIDGADNRDRASVRMPVVTKPRTAHFILKVTDKGSPPLTRYERVIVTIIPDGPEPSRR